MAGRELDGLKRWGQSRIRIGAPHSLCQFLLPTVLREFRDCFPRCEPAIEAGDTGTLLERLAEHELDLVLGLKTQAALTAKSRLLFEDKMALVVPPIHPWAESGVPNREDLEKVQFIIYARASETHRLLEKHFEEMGIRLRAPLVLGDMEAIKEMSKIGIGVGIIAPWVAKRELDEGTLVAIPTGGKLIVREWSIFWNADRPLSLIEETFAGISGMVGSELSRLSRF